MIGLTKNEIKVFEKVTRNPETVATIVLKTKMARMTVYTILLRLEKMGLVKQIESSSGNKMEWTRSKNEVIAKEIDRAKRLLLNTKVSKKTSKGYSHQDVVLYSGKKEVAAALVELTVRKDGAKMYSIQNSKNWKRWIDLMGKDWVNMHNKLVVKHKLICFTLHSPDAPEDIKKDSEVIAAYKGRLGNSHAIPESFLKRDVSFYIFEDTIFLVNLEKVEATSFTHGDIASFLIKMFSFMFEKGSEEEFFLKYNR